MKFKNLTYKTRKALSNEEYHSGEYNEFLSGSYLHKLFDDCPAAAEYGEHKETKALHFGTASHTAFLEPDLFALEYYREPSKEDYPDALSSDVAIKAYLKEMGQKGYSNKKGVELYEMVSAVDPLKKCLADIRNIEDIKNQGKAKLSAKDFDQIMLMRDTLLNDPANAELSNGDVEISIFGEISLDDGETWNKVKVRLDMLNKGNQITDYKSTGDASPIEFGKSAHHFGYWLKMALQYDLACALKELELPLPILLAQSKNSPYIAQAYRMTQEQIEKGREQYQSAIRVYNSCKTQGFWAYGGGVMDLTSPSWV